MTDSHYDLIGLSKVKTVTITI
uniref:Uncharacterized protein n=1 Tax=Anguilla anguilla TaxID=7936 RepID=A0A0E9RIK5_ANGAN